MKSLLLLLLAGLPALAGEVTIDNYNRAWLLMNDGHRTEAIEAAKAIIAADPTFHRAYHLIAEAENEDRHPEAAALYFRERAAADPLNPWPYYGLARLEEQLQNRVAAKSNSRKCTRLSADAWPCYVALGLMSDSEHELNLDIPGRQAAPVCFSLSQNST